ncbi:MAG: META domain-containing protein [Sulfuricurvum sp.]|uniref:META domain-containing protein n=1 Tax=Sulfuricurvum sp. TaxID=2025608 RepID=UPI0026122570|nr:META domain-containing protein [Sulfuricurvum sp.]MDD2828309.1 META domain-containing protein [Sulfuricurvum sp.]MDD4949736.1 META domain-containing protein [Sulfuricurvum sp.]
MKKQIFLAISLSLLFTGCVTSQHEAPVPQTSLDGSWKSTTSNAHIRFEKGKLSGNDGCNQFIGSYSSDGTRITVSENMMSTMMACPAMEQSANFKTALISAKIYENNTSTLVLLGADGKPLLELQALSKIPVEGVYSLNYLNNGKQIITQVKSPITMILSNDGKMDGSTGCNQYTTTYTIKENQITIGFPATTRMICTPELMEQEQNFISALQKSSKISRNGERWEVRDDTGALQFSMIQK